MMITVDLSDAALALYYATGEHIPTPAPEPHACVQLTAPGGSALGRYDASQGCVVPLRVPEDILGIRARNREQRFALDLLLDDSVQLVTLVGKAGTGKTLLALAAAVSRTSAGAYDHVLVSRPIVPMGRDLGYLPGTVDEKLNPWIQPIHDNLAALRGDHSDQVQVEPLTYIRGRSLPRQYLIVDEAQNLTHHEVKTIITRAGAGTKVVLTGDPAQIDLPGVTRSNNGLSIVARRFEGVAIAGRVELCKSERSELAEIASNVL